MDTPAACAMIRSLGLGLDENAMAAVAQWRFQPGEKEGSQSFGAGHDRSEFPAAAESWLRAGLAYAARGIPERGWRNAAGRSLSRSFHRTAIRPRPAPSRFRASSTSKACRRHCVWKNDRSRLDAEAMAIVREWRFSPAMKDGKPVAVDATMEVSFGSPGAPKIPAAPVTKL